MSILVIQKIITAISTFLSLGSLIILLLQRSSDEQKLASTFSYFSIISCIGYLGILLSDGNEEMLIFATKLKYAGSFSLYTVLPLAIRYFQFKVKVIPRILLNASVILCALLVFTFDIEALPSSTWFFSEYYPEFRNGLPYLHKGYAWGHHLYVGLALVYTIIATHSFIKVTKSKKFFDKKNLILLYFIIISPALFYLFEKAFRALMGVELIPIVPVSIAISNILFVHLIAGRKFCDVNDLANNTLFDLISSPAIVISKKNQITNFNNSALGTFGTLSTSLIGKDATENLPEGLSKAFLKLIDTMQESREAVVSINEDQYLITTNQRTYQPKLRKISLGAELQGYILWMEDITLLKRYSEQLETEVFQKTAEIKENETKLKTNALLLKQLRDQMIIGFSTLAEHHDKTTEGHLMRTSLYVQVIGEELKREGKYAKILTDEYISNLTHVAPLHDIGKTYISENICNKPSKLDMFEFEKMKEHTTMGAEFIEQNLKANVDPLYYGMAYDVVKYHHEWWNGKGYPCGLKEEDIPLSARIMAVADVYDALRTARPYKASFDSETAFSIIQEQRGIHFDPVIVDAFLSIREQIDEISRNTNI